MNIRLLNDDVALKFIPLSEFLGSIIHVEEDPDDVVKYYKVLAVADGVTDVRVGDTVVAPWTKVTNILKAPIAGVETPINITSVKEILGVVER